MNKPYVKQYNDLGVLLNPINGSYKSTSPNRQERRKANNMPNFIGNKKGISLTVVKISNLSFQKYKKSIQTIRLKDGGFKFIKHTILT